MQFTLFLLCLALAALGIMAPGLRRFYPRYLWQWKFSILSTEFGHWLSLLALILAVISFKYHYLVLGILFLATIPLFLTPLYLALQKRDVWAKELGLTQVISLRQLWSIRQLPRGVPKNPPERIIYSQIAGKSLVMDFYRPLPMSIPAPWVLVVHGGGWDSGDQTQLPNLNHLLVSHGYAVASMSYRLAPEHKWPAPHEDVAAAIRYLKKESSTLGIDPARGAVLGRSAGGQIALSYAYGAKDPSIKGCISFYAPTDMKVAYRLGKEKDILNSRPLVRAYMGDAPQKIPEIYAEASPLKLLDDHQCPTLILHGRPDTLVWHYHGRRLSNKLLKLGVPHTYVDFDWAVHGFDFNLKGPAGQVSTKAVLSFLEKHLK